MLEHSSLVPTDWSASEADQVRDRVVILGRRRAGKTVYLSRLYQKLWEGNEGVSARAGDGAMHERCMEICGDLAQGKWPSATAGSILSELEIVYDDRTAHLVVLDYPGEVFRRALVDGARDDQALSLLEHIDRAAGVILLIDPANLEEGTTSSQVDDDYGMVQAVDRIRKSSGGTSVPIAVVLTKCDEHVQLIRDTGTPREYIEAKIPNLFRYGGTLRVFASSAVRTRRDAIGRGIPNTEKPARGLIEPLRYCLQSAHEHQGPLATPAPISSTPPDVVAPITPAVSTAAPKVPIWIVMLGTIAIAFLILVVTLVLIG